MGILDRAISWAWPEAGLRRELARAALRQVRGYDAAKTGRRTEGWITGGTGPNAENGPALSIVRARARDLTRNNPYAAQAVRKLAAKAVGSGIVASAASSDSSVKAAAARAWERFVEASEPSGLTDFYGQQAQAVRTMVESGEALVLILRRPPFQGFSFPLQLRVLEGDYLDAGKSEDLANGNRIVQGVEFDVYGRRAAYWLFDDHPGESFPLRIGSRGLVSRRVAARDVLHVFHPLRADQVRGVSWFAPSVLRLRDAGEYDEAQLVAKKIQAMLVAFRKRPEGVAGSPLAQKTDERGRRSATLAPGVIMDLDPGEEMQFTEPKAVADYSSYMTAQLRAVAAGIGLTYEAMTGDWSQANYSSQRAAAVDFQDVLDQIQWTILAPQLLAPVWRQVMETAALDDPVLRGALIRDGRIGAALRMPRRRFVDPVKEIEGEKAAVRAGFKLQDEVIAEFTGEDPAAFRAARAAENAANDAFGLVFDSDSRRPESSPAPSLGPAPFDEIIVRPPEAA